MPPLTIVAAQSRSIRGDIEANVARHLRMAGRATEHGACLVVFPELSLTGYERTLAAECAIAPSDARLAPLGDLARAAGVTIVAGVPIRTNGRPFLAAIAFTPTGVAAYHKQHLHGPEHDFFTAGTHGVTLSVDDTTVALAICADIGHAAHAAAGAAAGAQIYAAGVMLTPETYAPDAALMAHYAEEHHLATLLANYSGATGGYQTAGRSAIWDDTGQQIAASDDDAPSGSEPSSTRTATSLVPDRRGRRHPDARRHVARTAAG